MKQKVKVKVEMPVACDGCFYSEDCFELCVVAKDKRKKQKACGNYLRVD